MKKIIMSFICLTCLLGCSTNKTNDKTYNEISDKSDGVTDTVGDWYTRFEAGLKEKKINYSSKSSLDTSAIKAKEGYRYQTDKGYIDVYRYEDGDAYNDIIKNKKITFDGTNYQDVEMNGHYVIVKKDLQDGVLDVFRGLK